MDTSQLQILIDNYLVVIPYDKELVLAEKLTTLCYEKVVAMGLETPKYFDEIEFGLSSGQEIDLRNAIEFSLTHRNETESESSWVCYRVVEMFSILQHMRHAKNQHSWVENIVNYSCCVLNQLNDRTVFEDSALSPWHRYMIEQRPEGHRIVANIIAEYCP